MNRQAFGCWTTWSTSRTTCSRPSESIRRLKCDWSVGFAGHRLGMSRAESAFCSDGVKTCNHVNSVTKLTSAERVVARDWILWSVQLPVTVSDRRGLKGCTQHLAAEDPKRKKSNLDQRTSILTK